jgi:hypothetical protein
MEEVLAAEAGAILSRQLSRQRRDNLITVFRPGAVAGNSENVSPTSGTGTIDQQTPSVNASRVCQRTNPSVGNSENVAPLLRNSNSVSEPQ